MGIKHFFGKLRWKAIEAYCRRNYTLHASGPIVSFTFDDFPQSAYRVGGLILKKYGILGTYYASLGLVGQDKGLGKQFCTEDLEQLLRDGHELGSHTFDHLSCRSSSFGDFQDNVMKGIEAVTNLTGTGAPRQFSYPKGHVTFKAKKRIGSCFASCRGIIPGINKSPVDLNLLRANSLYFNNFETGAIDRLFELNEKYKGWLIFYTHDISENPSPYGCTPSQFEFVVKKSFNSKSNILTIGQVQSNTPVVTSRANGLIC